MFKKWKALFKKGKATGCKNKRLSPAGRMLIYTLVPCKYAMVNMAKID